MERAPAAHHGPRSEAEWGSKDACPTLKCTRSGGSGLSQARQPVTFDRPRHPTERRRHPAAVSKIHGQKIIIRLALLFAGGYNLERVIIHEFGH